MAAIWAKSQEESEWELLTTQEFPDEAALHDLVEETPQLLPLAGNPQLVVVGREVRLGSGSADLLAIEPSGRPAVIEVKLARNAEARRAILAQALAYAAFLAGLSLAELEELVRGYLQQKEHDTIGAAVADATQDAAFDPDAFRPPWKKLSSPESSVWFSCWTRRPRS